VSGDRTADAPFDSLPPEQQARLLAAGRAVAFAPGQTLIEHGDADSGFYVIRSGRARVERSGHPIAEIGPGDFAGEFGASDWGALHSLRRVASVIADTDVQAVLISGERFDQLLAELPEFRAAVDAVLRERMSTI
jgi:CRP-like cAMP-binding protein